MNKIRAYLFAGSTLTIILVAVFLWVLNVGKPSEYTTEPFNILIILTIIAIICLAAFFAKGPVFNIYGKLEAVNINAILITVLVIIQMAFFFEIISVHNQILNYQVYDKIRYATTVAERSTDEDLDRDLTHLLSFSITDIMVLDEDGNVIHSSDQNLIGTLSVEDNYTFPFGDGRRIKFIIDRTYNHDELRNEILDLLTVLVTSIFFSVEIVIMMLRIIQRKIEASITDDSLGTAIVEDDQSKMISALYYIRQISFVFYFASRLSSAFIPTMAKELINPLSFISDNTAAGLPQSAETLLTCSAIFITTIILERKGWKLPFMSGLILVALGTFISAVSPNLPVFILSRAVVGLGYGLCWMTLRNLSLFGKNEKEKLLGFALLNAGIYAGMNCGSALGAILADIFGYRTVFVISAVLTIMTSLFIIKLENSILPRKNTNNAKKDVDSLHTDTKEGKVLSSDTIPFAQKIQAIIFVILMIAPASIAASYLTYYLPLYFQNMGASTTDVGRAQLIYGIIIVYAGPMLSMFLITAADKSLKTMNIVYSLMIAVSLFVPGFGSGILLPFLGAGLLGLADSFGFGVQNNYYLSLPAIEHLGASRSLSVLSFTKKMLEMIGPFVFAAAIIIGYQAGIRLLAVIFGLMAILFIILGKKKNELHHNRRP